MKASVARWRYGVVVGGALAALAGCSKEWRNEWVPVFPDEIANQEKMEGAQKASAKITPTLEPATRPVEKPPYVVDVGFPASGMRPVDWINQTGGADVYGPSGYGGGYGGGYQGGYGAPIYGPAGSDVGYYGP